MVTGLIILVVMTLLVLGMLRTNVLQLKIGGVSQVAEEHFANAELATVKYINDNSTFFQPGCLTQADMAKNCFCTSRTHDSSCHSASSDKIKTTYLAADGTHPQRLIMSGDVLSGAKKDRDAREIELRVRDLACVPSIEFGTAPGIFDAYFLDIEARSWFSTDNKDTDQPRAIVHVGIRVPVASGGCS